MAMEKIKRYAHTATNMVVCFAITLLMMVMLTGCSSGNKETQSQASDLADVANMDFTYSDRDKNASYDEASAVVIDLSSSADESGIVEINSEGAYIVSGELTDGQLVVDVDSEEKVQVIFNGVTIHNENGPAVYVKSADKVFLTLAPNSSNFLSDGSLYDLEEGSDEPYATLFSKDDLTINGEGSLSVISKYRHAVCSKDDLVITGGVFTIDAAEDGLRGRDCVKILDGDFTITAKEDAIKSNNDEDPTRGFVSIDGGAFEIDAGDDGVNAYTYYRVMDGVIGLVSADDSFNSEVHGLIAGGILTIKAGDDALHCEYDLTIEGGDIAISSSVEGLEGQAVSVKGGAIRIVASDDGINAASSESATKTDSTTTPTVTDEQGFALDSFSKEGMESGAMSPSQEGQISDMENMSGGVQQPSTKQLQTPPAKPEGMNSSAADNMQMPEQPNATQDMGGADQLGGMGSFESDENCSISISGGYVVIDAQGDGIDSNGSLDISGGTVLVNGPEKGDGAALDYALSANITGGTVLMVGQSGMAVGFSEGTQPFALVQAVGSTGDSVAVADDSGTVLASLTAVRGFQSVVISCPGLEEGEKVNLVVGGTLSSGNEDGFTNNGDVSGGNSTAVTLQHKRQVQADLAG